MGEVRQKTKKETDALEGARTVAEAVRKAGGRALLVGGCVRDELRRGAASADYDVECFGIAPDRLQAVLASHFELDLVGASFGVIKLHHLEVDV